MLNIIEGKEQRPKKIVIYGPEGIGKSTFASQFPDPLFIDTEGGTSNLDVRRKRSMLIHMFVRQSFLIQLTGLKHYVPMQYVKNTEKTI
jgi:GTPase SAR1 family protein